MVSTPPTPTADASATASAPLSQDQFNAYVQSTYGRYPLTIVRGEGCKLFDSNGKVCTDHLDVWSVVVGGEGTVCGDTCFQQASN